jgi:hypothetical protein
MSHLCVLFPLPDSQHQLAFTFAGVCNPEGQKKLLNLQVHCSTKQLSQLLLLLLLLL